MNYITLRDNDTFYEMVAPLVLLTHIAYGIGGLKITNVVALVGKLPVYWASNPRFLQFIMPMEGAQKKAAHAYLPIAGNWLATFATTSLLLANSFPDDRSVWDEKPKTNQTWQAWKDFSPSSTNTLSVRHVW